jgi:glycolate oxidase FAD binding subunit
MQARADDLAERHALAIAGRVPGAVVVPPTREALVACVRDAAGAGAAIVPLGLGAHRGLGHAPERYDVALSTRALTRIIDYVPADMTVTVESGTTLAALDAVLAREGQWLPLAVPLPAETTVGGLIAADLSGLLRAAQGRVRDYVIGIAMVTAEGREARAGGRVVKNVAGYDLMKLLIGSLGTLAIVTEATVKIRPRPETLRVVALTCADRDAGLALATRLVDLDEVALAIAMLATPGEARPTLCCLLGGVAVDVAATRERLVHHARVVEAVVTCDEPADGPIPSALLAGARDLPRVAPGELVLRAAALRTRAPGLAAALLADLGDLAVHALFDPRAGALTIAVATDDAAGVIARARVVSARHEATLTIERWPDALATSIEVWSPPPSALPLMRRIKQALDPARTLAPGRFVGRL